MLLQGRFWDPWKTENAPKTTLLRIGWHFDQGGLEKHEQIMEIDTLLEGS